MDGIDFYRRLTDNSTSIPKRHRVLRRVKCHVCKNLFHSVPILYEHVRENHSDRAFFVTKYRFMDCPMCKRYYDYRYLLSEHMERAHEYRESVEGYHTWRANHRCERCDTPFQYKHNLTKHLLRCRHTSVSLYFFVDLRSVLFCTRLHARINTIFFL